MLNKLLLVAFAFSITYITQAQTTDIDNYVKEGIKLYDNGDYKGAIEQYKKALAIDSNSTAANYEMSSALFALKEYDKAIDYSDKVIRMHSTNERLAYILKGSALDILSRPDDAIKTYKEGLVAYPDSYLLYFNLALTQFNNKGDVKEIETNLQLALKNNPLHPTSHLLLAYLMINQNKRTQSLLALYNFLLLEPTGKRAEKALELLNIQMKKGVKKDNDKSTTITLFTDGRDDDFAPAELMLSMLEASKNSKENKGKSSNEMFIENTSSFFAVLGELKKKDGFWWDFYVDFFYALKNKNMTESLCYYIMQSGEDKDVKTWLASNTDKTDSLIKWTEDYKRK